MPSKFILISIFLSGSWAVTCPPAQYLFPWCRCTQESLRISCSQPNNDTAIWDIKATFDKLAPILEPDFVFNQLRLGATSLRTIPAGALQTIKFKEINIELNHYLEYIHPDAFGETANVTTYLCIQNNRYLTNDGEGHTERDLYDVLTKFKNATDIIIQGNSLKSIPDEGFGPLPNLRRIQLISHQDTRRIGSRAFSRLPSLESADLRYSGIILNGIADDAFEGIGSKVELNMENNNFVRLPEIPFKQLLDNGRGLAVGGSHCVYPIGCTTIRLYCDEVSAWLCQNVESHQPKVKGFLCEFDSKYETIWDYCAGEVNNGTVPASVKH